MRNLKKAYLKTKFYVQTLSPVLKWNMYYDEKDRKCLALYKFHRGKRVWCRHFEINSVIDGKGYPYGEDEKRLQEIIANSNEYCTGI